MAVAELTIDPEFRDTLPPLTVDEKTQLRAQIESDGCTDPIILWANHDSTIVDGHNRYDICSSLNVPFKTKAMKFETREEIIAWIVTRQGGRRNISREKLRYIRGQAYNSRKKAVGEHKGNQHTRKAESGNDCHIPKTAEIVATEYGVSEKTIRNDATFATTLNKLPSTDRKAILDGTRKTLSSNGDESSHKEEILARLKDGPAIKENLLSISPKYTGRISDLRDDGINIVFKDDVYRIESGKPTKAKPKLPKGMRYEKPNGTDAAFDRIKELVVECNVIAKKNKFQANHVRLCRLVRELGEIVQCFEAGKK